jgi:phage shock protein A
MSGMSEHSAFEAFARMEAKISDNERRLSAHAEIDEEFSGDRLARDFKQLEQGAATGNADMQLLALKQKMGILQPPTPAQNKQIGAGDASNHDETPAAAEAEDVSADGTHHP